MPRWNPENGAIILHKHVSFSIMIDTGLVSTVIQINVGFPDLVAVEMHLSHVAKLLWIPCQPRILPGKSHPPIHSDDGQPLLNVEMDQGHAHADHNWLGVILHGVNG